jgi:hypothetical protein
MFGMLGMFGVWGWPPRPCAPAPAAQANTAPVAITSRTNLSRDLIHTISRCPFKTSKDEVVQGSTPDQAPHDSEDFLNFS